MKPNWQGNSMRIPESKKRTPFKRGQCTESNHLHIGDSAGYGGRESYKRNQLDVEAGSHTKVITLMQRIVQDVEAESLTRLIILMQRIVQGVEAGSHTRVIILIHRIIQGVEAGSHTRLIILNDLMQRLAQAVEAESSKSNHLDAEDSAGCGGRGSYQK